ncbi:amphi-Trp domain-containing protein [Halobellus sp. GM3]|uniref:amphi-Trp domain-containing protein n=1 Tax=Halobellus sp. GM3 TaxID=3458410 RepID=UPI00403E1780
MIDVRRSSLQIGGIARPLRDRRGSRRRRPDRGGEVHLESQTDTREVNVPETALFEVELERLTDSETGEERYELEYEVRWSE